MSVYDAKGDIAMTTPSTMEFKEMLVNKGIDVVIGSFYRYNNSNVNHQRKDHVARDAESMIPYCTENKVIKGYIRPLLKRGEYSFIALNLCVKCVREFTKENLN